MEQPWMIKYTPIFLESPSIPESSALDPIWLGQEDKSSIIEIKTTPNDNSSTVYNAPSVPSVSNLDLAREMIETRSADTTTSDVNNTVAHNWFFEQPLDVGKMADFLTLAEQNGVLFKVTSGVRNTTTSSGQRSRHADGLAIDIVPLEGETFDDLINKFKNSPELLKYMKENDIGFLTEITEEEMKKYGSTGPNIHISVPGANKNYGEASALNSRKKALGF